MIGRVLRRLAPGRLWSSARRYLSIALHRLKEPRMVWGYEDSSGEWRAKTRISDTVYFCHPEKINIGDNVFIGHYSILDGTGGLEIGEGCQLAGWNGIYSHSSHIAIRIYGKHYHEVPEEDKAAFKQAPVRIGKYSFIGAGAIVFSGVTIGQGALIAAGSIVNKNVGDFEFVAGNPAKLIGSTKKLDETYLKDPQLLAWYEEWQKT